MWIIIISSQIFKSFSLFIQHNIPNGSPIFLSFVLFLIENIRNFIRPITLGFRICAITSGANIIINLCASIFLSFFPFFLLRVKNLSIFRFFFPIITILFSYDLIVCCVQGYIFVRLLNNYSEEHN
jgi:F0F1-type ATP synthase membrane subunit a